MEAVNNFERSTLIPDFERQDDIFSSPFSVLREAIVQSAFPAASIAVTHKGRLIALKTFGKFVYESDLEDGHAVAPPFLRFLREGGDIKAQPDTLFDLASLTKVVATTTVAAMLYERGLLELDAPILGTIPEFLRDVTGQSDPRRSEVTFRMLLAHSSGLPAYEKLFLRCDSREELLQAAFTTPLTADPGTLAEYSDIGFIILGVALERIAGESLDRFCQREIFGPLAMTHTAFTLPVDLRPKIPPTADEREHSRGPSSCAAGALAREHPSSVDQASHARSSFRRRIIQGEVQDENAFVLGGVAGHAGLFSTAEDLARFAHALLQCGIGASAQDTQSDEPTENSHDFGQVETNPVMSGETLHSSGAFPLILRPETIALFTQHQSSPPNTSRALGWDTPSQPSQSGKCFGPHSFGHLGYTGTSLWIDPDRQLSVVLLTNRTWPDCFNQAIKQVRPRFHDAVMEALER
jgi:serine-type D-Ala-D-Ala carboxypeptidase